MASSDEKVILKQRNALKEAENAPSYRVVRMLHELIVSDREQLLPDWRGIWQRVSNDVRRDHEAPDGVIDRIDDAISKISSIADLTKISLQPEGGFKTEVQHRDY